MSRTKAKEIIDLDEYTNTMTDVYSSSVSKSTLDEAPQAYKTMEEIKTTITDTVEVLDVIKSVYNFKAH